jgi:hypothetical protein
MQAARSQRFVRPRVSNAGASTLHAVDCRGDRRYGAVRETSLVDSLKPSENRSLSVSSISHKKQVAVSMRRRGLEPPPG